MQLTNDDIIQLEKVRGSIMKDLAVHYRIEELAMIALMSRSNLIRKYKQHFGVSLYDQLLSLRLILAKHLLDSTDDPIKQIAKKCGYRQACNFSTGFKKMYGMTPREFRGSCEL